MLNSLLLYINTLKKGIKKKKKRKYVTLQSETSLFIHLHSTAQVTHTHTHVKKLPQTFHFFSLLLSASDESRRQFEEKKGSFKN